TPRRVQRRLRTKSLPLAVPTMQRCGRPNGSCSQTAAKQVGRPCWREASAGAAAMIVDAVHGRAVHPRPRLALAEDRQTDIRPKLQSLVRQNGDVAAVGLAVLRIVHIPGPGIRAGGFETAYDNESADPLCSLCRIGIVLVKPTRSVPIAGALQPNDPTAKLSTAGADGQGGIFIRRQPDSSWVRRCGRS